MRGTKCVSCIYLTYCDLKLCVELSAFPVFISPIVWNMYENLPYESVYFKEPHNEQECYRPTIYRAGEAVVLTITSFTLITIRWLLDFLSR